MYRRDNASVPRSAVNVIWLAGLICGLLGIMAVIRHAGAQQQPGQASRQQVGQAATGPASQPMGTDAATIVQNRWTAELRTKRRAALDARAALVDLSLVASVDPAAIREKVNAIRAAEQAFADAQADAVAQSQRAVATKAAMDRGRRIPNIPNLNSEQAAALTSMAGVVIDPTRNLSKLREHLSQVALSEPRDESAIKAAADAVATAEMNLAIIRKDAFTKVQASPQKLSVEQISALSTMGGMIQLGGFSEPKPIDFNDHEGYVSLFDGVSLNGWDGNHKIWRVENGNIIGESTPENPSGNTYLVYRDQQAKDFTLKFEIKIDGTGGSGMQYRSKTGVPWLAPVADNVLPVNLDWMMTGPQADFWPTQIYSGQFYSENTPMRIIAWRGQVVESSGLATKRLMGQIGNRKSLGDFEKKNDWNQYTVIARGGTFIHIMNGQLMSVLVDDDPTSSNNQSGLIGIEIESITKLYVRNIWLKKLI